MPLSLRGADGELTACAGVFSAVEKIPPVVRQPLACMSDGLLKIRQMNVRDTFSFKSISIVAVSFLAQIAKNRVFFV